MHSDRKFRENDRKFREKNLKLWENKLLDVFNTIIPKHYEWDDITEIIDIIEIIGVEGLNHMLYPAGGGDDVSGCNMSKQRMASIEILTGGSSTMGVSTICKPRKLIFDCIDNEPSWSYFWLELNQQKPEEIYLEYSDIHNWFVYSDEDEFYLEELERCENNEHFELNNKYPLRSRKHIYLLKGKLLIMPKAFFYNYMHESYDGLHNKYTHQRFRNKMEKIKKKFDASLLESSSDIRHYWYPF